MLGRRGSIKRNVWIRGSAAVAAIILLAAVMMGSIARIRSTQEGSAEASMVHSNALSAEVAHYKWSANLSNACSRRLCSAVTAQVSSYA